MRKSLLLFAGLERKRFSRSKLFVSAERIEISMQFSRSLVLALNLAFCLVMGMSRAQAQFTFSGDTTGKPTFKRPTSTTALSTTATAVPYEAYTFVATTTGYHRIISSPTTNWNNYVVVYAGAFNPASPLTNIFAVNEDYGVNSGFPTLGILNAGSTYTVVTTGSTNTSFGPYTLSIDALTVKGTTTGGSTFNRPASSVPGLPVNFPIYPVDALSPTATAVAYQTQTFTPSVGGEYQVLGQRLNSTTWNPFMVLYKGTFDPSNPLTNAVIANDDNSATSTTFTTFTISLEAGQPYTLVFTGSTNADAGDYYYSFELLYPFKAGVNTTTTGRPLLDVSTYGSLFSPAITDFGNAVPYRLFKIDFAAPGNYSLLYLAQTPGLSPFIAFYVSPFDPATAPSTATLFTATTYRNSNAFILPFNLTTLASNVTLYAVVVGHKNSMVGNFRLEGFGPDAVTITPVTTVKGTVQLKTFLDNPPAAVTNYPVNLIFRPVGGGSDTNVPLTLTSANGNYLLNLPEGNYNVGIKSPRTLQKVILNVDTATNNVSGLNATLIGVDSNDDNFSDVTELLAVINSYNQQKNTPANNTLYKEAADFNFDGVNDVSDLLLIINNYNKMGEFLP